MPSSTNSFLYSTSLLSACGSLPSLRQGRRVAPANFRERAYQPKLAEGVFSEVHMILIPLLSCAHPMLRFVRNTAPKFLVTRSACEEVMETKTDLSSSS